MAAVVWVLTAVFYFYQYALRSAPAVMMPQLSDAFNLTATGVASMVGLFYYGYSPFSLVAGAAMDRLGPRGLVPLAVVVVGLGALLFATGNNEAASIGRFMQGAGGVFALVGVLAGRLGSLHLAAHQVAISLASFTFCAAVGVGQAARNRGDMDRQAGRGKMTLDALGF